MLAVFTVNVDFDERDESITDGDISLRDAILAATDAGSGNTVNFHSSLNGATIALEDFLYQIEFDESLTIDASNLSNGITISAPTADRIFEILDSTNGAAPPSVTLKNLTFLNGNPNPVLWNGGAIQSAGFLTIDDCTFSGNSAGSGGAVYVEVLGGGATARNVLTITNSTFENNFASGNGGAVAVVSGNTSNFTNDTITITNTAFSDNGFYTDINGPHTTSAGGGLYAQLYGAGLTVTGGKFDDNSGGGGGLYVDARGNSTITSSMQITGVHFDGNQGGGMRAILNNYTSLTVDQTLFTMNDNTLNDGSGGGLHLVADGANASATIERSEFRYGNVAGDGGGMYVLTDNGASVEISRSLFLNNHAEEVTSRQGGGLYAQISGDASALTIEDSRFQSNSAAADGGGIMAVFDGADDDAQLTIAGCEISENSAVHHGGGLMVINDDVGDSRPRVAIYNTTISGNRAGDPEVFSADGSGGGVEFNERIEAVLHHATIARNIAYTGGGIRTIGSLGDSAVRLVNSIIVENYYYTGTGSNTAASNIYGLFDTTNMHHNIIAYSPSPSGVDLVQNYVTGSATAPGSLVAGPANLAQLQFNGGPTRTHQLGSGSTAIDAGDNNFATIPFTTTPLETDQRGPGFPRVYNVPGVNDPGDIVDIGAYEWMEGPQVLDVIISGSNSVDDPFSFSAMRSLADTGEQLITVPVGGADTISIVFSEPVTVTEDKLTITGMFTTQQPEFWDFSYETETYTATWSTYGLPFDDMWLISLSEEVTNADGISLDGEWVNPVSIEPENEGAKGFPSGDGQAGVDFNFVFTLLGGDFTLDNLVDGDDWEILETYFESYFGGFEYGDADGDGYVTYSDMVAWAHTEGFDFQFLLPLRGDLDNDFDVDTDDYYILYSNWENELQNPTMADGDLNGDDILDINDFDLLLKQFGFRLTVVS